LDTLVNGYQDDKGKHIAPGKHVNPECVSCHTTGFLYRTGYDGTAKTVQLGGNGCENCHDPASEHVAVYSHPKSKKEDQVRTNKQLHLEPQTDDEPPGSTPSSRGGNLCIRCHDYENDPGFKLDKRWAEVDHGVEAGEDQKLWPSIRAKLKSK